MELKPHDEFSREDEAAAYAVVAERDQVLVHNPQQDTLARQDRAAQGTRRTTPNRRWLSRSQKPAGTAKPHSRSVAMNPELKTSLDSISTAISGFGSKFDGASEAGRRHRHAHAEKLLWWRRSRRR